MNTLHRAGTWLLAATALSCASDKNSRKDCPEPVKPAAAAPVEKPKPTAADAEKFVNDAEAHLYELGMAANKAAWVQSTYITQDTQALSAAAQEAVMGAAVKYAQEAARFDGMELPYDVRRKLDLLKLALTSPPPADPAKVKELAVLSTRMEAQYGEGKYCPPGKTGKDCLDIGAITKIMADSRDPEKLKEVWTGWHAVGAQMRGDYQRLVELGNEGARSLGYPDQGAYWRAKYDMPPDAFAGEVERLWTQVKPLYDSLHCYVRGQLQKKYGEKVVPTGKPIPAHLLGNIWAQEWANIYPLVAPPNSDPGYDLNAILKKQNYDHIKMVKTGEGFFSSLGIAPLPETFWKRSLFLKPADREVVCHASAWDLDEVDDLRIKMCIEINEEDFGTIHHELGHNYYQRAYNKLPYLYRQGANDGFHEAIGDTILRSVTPDYLKKIGLIDKVPPPEKDLGLLMKEALESVAFLPFGLVVDQWRWKAFNGEIKPENFNKSWWEMRKKYQGIEPAMERPETFFDPGAKYHVPGNVPYTRYFLARILQYQFHR
ncbi:MAG: M2 family metallopeptidase, partial [Deltaproteobacteria bacterium]|nr:M2 family metallopeptidase [Deltaproteobacteria bacterium]